jgi:hypothetical protein
MSTFRKIEQNIVMCYIALERVGFSQGYDKDLYERQSLLVQVKKQIDKEIKDVAKAIEREELSKSNQITIDEVIQEETKVQDKVL